jgi:hypothetical protein
MTIKYASERAATIIHQAVDILKRAEAAPDSPVNTLQPRPVRKALRRDAKQLRKGQLRPNFENVITAPQLATIYERTAQRDEILERCGVELKRITLDLGAVMKEEGTEAVVKTFDTIYWETAAEAAAQGPGGEAAQRLQLLLLLITVASSNGSRSRRGKRSRWADEKPPLSSNPRLNRLMELTAAKILDDPPPNEPVVAIPAKDSGSGRERLVFRIGLREFSWVGSFEQGNRGANTVQLMPDGRLFVAACGAGYILDLKSRTLIEKIGDEVITVGRDDSGQLFIVNHDERIIECFGPAGRLWKTPPLGSGGFRGLTITGDEFLGEARQAEEPEWKAFKVKLATGKVAGAK